MFPSSPFRHLRCAPLTLTVAAALLLAGCAAQRDHWHGMNDMADGNPEQGVALLGRASRAEPDNARYRMDFLQQQAQAERAAIAQGDAARTRNDLEAARNAYAQALRLHPGSERALRGLAGAELDARHQAALSQAEGLLKAGELGEARELLHRVILENAANAHAQKLWTQLAEREEAAEQARRARTGPATAMRKPVTLQFRDANLRQVFEALSRTTGINVIFDRDVKSDLKTTIFVKEGAVEDTVDLILLQAQLEKKMLNANTFFIYPATSAKQKEYQDLKIRVFQLSNADGKALQGSLKAVLKGAEVSLDERTGTLVVRGTPDTLAVAEKLIAAQDQPDPEVMLEVEVLEVSRNRLSDLGIQWPVSFGVSEPSGVTTLSALNHLRLSQLVPTSGLGATANFKLEDSDADVLASPRIRVRDREKAKIMIGDRVPVFTQQLQPLASTGGTQIATAAYTSQVQYLDVGIKLEVEPHIYLEGDVGIKIGLEVSNLGAKVTDPTTGAQAYQISSRTASTSLRLRDGETQILGGLINDQNSRTKDMVPGLGQFPILDRIFGNASGTHLKDELVLSITPHLVRAPAVATRQQREIFAGTDSAVREAPLRLDPLGGLSTNGSVPPTPVLPASARAAVINAPGTGAETAPVAAGAQGAAPSASAGNAEGSHAGGGVAGPNLSGMGAPPVQDNAQPAARSRRSGGVPFGAGTPRAGDPGVFTNPETGETYRGAPPTASAPASPDSVPGEAPASAAATGGEGGDKAAAQGAAGAPHPAGGSDGVAAGAGAGAAAAAGASASESGQASPATGAGAPAAAEH